MPLTYIMQQIKQLLKVSQKLKIIFSLIHKLQKLQFGMC